MAKVKSKYSFNIVLMGDSHVGKTELIRTYIEHYFTKFDSHSLNANNNAYIKTTCIDGVGYTLNLWEWASTDHSEAARAENYTTFDPDVLRKADCLLLCYAINNFYSFKNMEAKWMRLIKRYSPAKTPIILVGTKLDVKNHYGTARISDLTVQKMRFRTKAVSVLECSARKFEGVSQVFKEALTAASENQQLHCVIM